MRTKFEICFLGAWRADGAPALRLYPAWAFPQLATPAFESAGSTWHGSVALAWGAMVIHWARLEIWTEVRTGIGRNAVRVFYAWLNLGLICA